MLLIMDVNRRILEMNNSHAEYSEAIRKVSANGPLSLWERVRVRAIETRAALLAIHAVNQPSPLPLSQRERGDYSDSLAVRGRQC
jgi:hypothetical protein